MPKATVERSTVVSFCGVDDVDFLRRGQAIARSGSVLRIRVGRVARMVSRAQWDGAG
jgi:hypothetical protein